MLVISPPSQGYGGRQPASGVRHLPHPRRSVREGSSLEFIYQLSRTSAVINGRRHRQLRIQPRCRCSRAADGAAISHRRLFRRLEVPAEEPQPWHHWHDNVSECFVAWDGDRGWMSSLGPRSVGFAAELADGLAVFDLDFDDHHGECGNKFPVLRALRAALIARHAKKLA
ncbi:hypothetical protein HPB49_008960 [Dermacentor silvarum]|uniref:Uncharacterized protein n=1 Tax=Dermacentor silvarum TaxID=543639 RepID=A0ACB8D467_DERSI|nr:hypothetical protein HPB49_008960 [Dermacentor silvarum]